MRIVSDLACELLQGRPARQAGIVSTTRHTRNLTVHQTKITNQTQAQAIGKPTGTYYNLAVTGRTAPRTTAETLTQILTELLPVHQKILVVGLGNDKITADSLGPAVLTKLRTGTQLITFEPSVFGVTGINSVDAIQAITQLTRPSAVVVIDSLVSAAPERIGTNYQICTSGITPGSGVGRNNQCIDQKLLGVPVLALGIPVCTVLTRDRKLYHLVPKDIDLVIQDCANVMAAALNKWAQQS